MRMRTIAEAIDYMHQVDPETALTKNALRVLIRDGAIPAIRIGNKSLISLETLESFLAGDYAPEPQQADGIRRVY